MSLHPTPPTAVTPPRRRHRGVLLSLLLAIALSLLVMLPGAPWVLEWRMVEYLIPWLLRPSTGFFSLVLALWLLFTVPGVLRRWSDDPARYDASEEGTPAEADEPAAEPEPFFGDLVEGETLRIPAGTFRELGAEHRWEMAQALDVPWRDELLDDHQSWAVACLEAAQRRAAELRR